MRARGALLALAFVALGAVLSCTPSARTPGGALEAFARALERGDHPAAYRLMSDAYRQRVPFEEFDRRMRATAPAAAAETKRLRDNAPHLGARVEVALGDDRRARLVREGASWHLDEPPIDPFRQDTPRGALLSFIRAAEQGRYDVLLTLAPERQRARLDEAALRAFWEGEGRDRRHALLGRLRLALGGAIVEDGDFAFLSTGGGQVRFVREGGAWRIETLD